MEGRLAEAAWELEQETLRRNPGLATERALREPRSKSKNPHWSAPHEEAGDAPAS